MITRETVLVLGAGASAAYRLPTALELTQQIVAQMPKRVGVLEKLKGIRKEHIDEFVRALARSDIASVDEFIGRRTEFMRVGKAAIADTLYRAEEPNRASLHYQQEGILDHTNPIDHWLELVWKHLRTDATPESFENNKLKIVTFNYDRMVEAYLTRVMVETFDLSNDEAIEIWQTAIPIVHVHGQLSDSRLVDEDGDPTTSQLTESIDTIRVLPESSGGDEPFALAGEYLENAWAVCFLGFSYHPDNLRRLDVKNKTAKKHVWGTAVGMTEAECRKVAHVMGKVWDGQSEEPEFVTDPEIKGCRDFLRRFNFLLE